MICIFLIRGQRENTAAKANWKNHTAQLSTEEYFLSFSKHQTVLQVAEILLAPLYHEKSGKYLSSSSLGRHAARWVTLTGKHSEVV